jgi:catechol 2,3-dioxygenase-like lactoylglutathione lyase family enzyme
MDTADNHRRKPILELRVALTTADYERMLRFYQVGLGLDPAELWTNEQVRSQAVLFDMGRRTLEIFNEEHAHSVDQIEAGSRVSGQIRFALQVPDLEAAISRLLAHGATLVHPPVVSPWGHHNGHLEDPDGMRSRCFKFLSKKWKSCHPGRPGRWQLPGN